MDEALALGLRITRFLTALVLTAVFVLASTLVLPLTTRLGLFGVMRLAGLAFAERDLRREVFGLLRAARRTVRAAGFTASFERGFFVLILGYDPFGRRRILSDAPYITAAA
jgi:hypothetical protein